MARAEEGILGGFKGKIGPVVGYERRGKFIMRSLPKVIRPRTPGQLAVLQRMTVLSRFFNSINDYLFIGFGLEAAGKSRTANNAAKSYNLKHAIKGEYPDQELNYSEIKLTSGELQLPVNIAVETSEEGLNFSWDTAENLRGGNWDDQVMIMTYIPEVYVVNQITAGAQRSAGKQFVPVHPYHKGKTVEVYVSFIAENRKGISNSRYLGNIVF